MQNVLYKNEFDFYENEPVCGIHFHMNCFPRGLVLTQRQLAILIGWHITVSVTSVGLFDTNVKKIIIKFSTVQHVQLSSKVTIVRVIFVQLSKLHIRFVWV